MDNVIKIIKTLENSGLLIGGASKTVNHEVEKQERGFLPAMMVPMAASLIASMASSLIQSVAYPLINAITGKGVIKAGKGQEDGILPLLTLPSMMKLLGKEVTSAGKGDNNMNHMDKILVLPNPIPSPSSNNLDD